MFKTKIIEVGKSADYFRGQGLMVLFSEAVEGIPMDYSYRIHKVPVTDNIQEGMAVYLDDEPYKITAVGNDVCHNLNEYGHITMRFDGSTKATMPGTLYLEEKNCPLLMKIWQLKFVKERTFVKYKKMILTDVYFLK